MYKAYVCLYVCAICVVYVCKRRGGAEGRGWREARKRRDRKKFYRATKQTDEDTGALCRDGHVYKRHQLIQMQSEVAFHLLESVYLQWLPTHLSTWQHAEAPWNKLPVVTPHNSHNRKTSGLVHKQQNPLNYKSALALLVYDDPAPVLQHLGVSFWGEKKSLGTSHRKVRNI